MSRLLEIDFELSYDAFAESQLPPAKAGGLPTEWASGLVDDSPLPRRTVKRLWLRIDPLHGVGPDHGLSLCLVCLFDLVDKTGKSNLG